MRGRGGGGGGVREEEEVGGDEAAAHRAPRLQPLETRGTRGRVATRQRHPGHRWLENIENKLPLIVVISIGSRVLSLNIILYFKTVSMNY